MSKLTLDRKKFSAKFGTKDVHLAPKEFNLVALLEDADGACLSRADIAETLWPKLAPDERTIDQHVARIRGKTNADVIITVQTRGYRIGDK